MIERPTEWPSPTERADPAAPAECTERRSDPADPARDPLHEIVGRVREITRANEHLFARLIDGERRFRSLAKAVWKVQEDERRRLARELHDGLGQTLTALTHQLERLREKVEAGASAREAGGGASDRGAGTGEASDRGAGTGEASGRGAGTGGASDHEIAARLADSVELARLALNETRELSRLLRPPVLDDLGLAPALSWLARTLEQRTGLKVELAVDLSGDPAAGGRLDPDLETLVFRLVQEALTNVLRHAGAGRAQVAVRRAGEELELRVADAGRGFDPRAVLVGGAAGSGLRGMRDRLDLFGGHLEIVSAPGQGTVVSAVIPLLSPEGAAEA